MTKFLDWINKVSYPLKTLLLDFLYIFSPTIIVITILMYLTMLLTAFLLLLKPDFPYPGDIPIVARLLIANSTTNKPMQSLTIGKNVTQNNDEAVLKNNSKAILKGNIASITYWTPETINTTMQFILFFAGTVAIIGYILPILDKRNEAKQTKSNIRAGLKVELLTNINTVMNDLEVSWQNAVYNKLLENFHLIKDQTMYKWLNEIYALGNTYASDMYLANSEYRFILYEKNTKLKYDVSEIIKRCSDLLAEEIIYAKTITGQLLIEKNQLENIIKHCIKIRNIEKDAHKERIIMHNAAKLHLHKISKEITKFLEKKPSEGISYTKLEELNKNFNAIHLSRYKTWYFTDQYPNTEKFIISYRENIRKEYKEIPEKNLEIFISKFIDKIIT